MKKFKNIKLMLLGLLCLGSMNAFADDPLTNGTLKFIIEGGKATITGFAKDKAAADLVIPNKITNIADGKEYTVGKVEEKAFLADKGKIETIDLQATAVETITKDLFSGLSKLKSIKLGSSVKTIAEGAFVGTALESLDLSATSVTTVEKLFGTNCSYIGPYTADQAEAANVAILGGYKKDGNGGTAVFEGDEKTAGGVTGGTAFAGYNEINKYYKEHYAGAKKIGEKKPYTLETANAYNTTTFTNKANCKKAGDPILYTQDEVDAYNATLEGAMTAGDELTPYKFSLFDAVATLNGLHVQGDKITAQEANIYNAQLPGAITIATQKKDEEGNPAVYDEQGAYDYNYALYYGKEGGEGLAVIGNESAESFASHLEAYNYNNTYVVPEAEQMKIDDINPDTQTVVDPTYWTKEDAYAKNYELADAKKPGEAVWEGDPKDTPQDPIANKTLTSVKLNKKWTSIKTSAFENCQALATISFGGAEKALAEQAQAISDRAFLGTAITAFDFVGTNVTTLQSDMFVDYDESYTEDVPENATLTTVTFNKYLKAVPAEIFGNCTALATVTFEDRDIESESAPGSPVVFKAECEFTGVGSFAFANTAIAAIVIPEALDASKGSNISAIAENAFAGCEELKSFTYMIDNQTTNIKAVVDNLAFPGCSDVSYNTTNANVAKYMSLDKKAPKNSFFNIVSGDGYVTPFNPIKYKNANKWYIKYKAVAAIKVKKDEAKVYNAYLDDDDLTLNMALYKASGGYYKIGAGETVLIITTNENLKFETGAGSSAMWTGTNALKIVEAKEGVSRTYLDWDAGADKVIYGWVNSSAGTGWQKIATGNTFPQGTMYILAAEPADGSRLKVNWLDENGNVEETTGIEDVINVNEISNEAIFNLQGIRVNKANKGLYIQNGKKYVVK